MLGTTLYLSFSPSAKEIILKPLMAMEDFSIKWWLIIYAVGSLATLMGLPLTLFELTVSSIVPHFWFAFTVCVAGKVTGSTGSFIIGRMVLRNRLQRSLAENTYFLTLQTAVKTTPLKFAILFKFLMIPHFMKNFSLAISDLSFKHFVIATFVACTGYSIVWVNVGHSMRGIYIGISKEGANVSGQFSLARTIILGVSALVTLYIVLYAKAIYSELMEEQEALANACISSSSSLSHESNDEEYPYVFTIRNCRKQKKDSKLRNLKSLLHLTWLEEEKLLLRNEKWSKSMVL